MAQVSASQSFDMSVLLDFSQLGEIANDFAFLDNINFGLQGAVFQDIAAYQYFTDTSHLVAFGGTNFSFIGDVPVSGTVTGIAFTDGALADGLGGQTLDALISGISVTAVEVAQAVASASSTDDLVVLNKMFGGNDRFDLSEGNDLAFGLGGADTMFGNGGNDILSGGAGNDSLFGGAGDDLLFSGDGANVLNGGTGFDTVSYASATVGQTIKLGLTGAQANGDKLTSIEQVIGTKFNDALTAASTGSTLQGMGGADRLIGGAASDALFGGAGKDTLTGGGGKDAFVFNTAPGLANRDLITDFKHGIDKIELATAIFGKQSVISGHLAPAAFFAGAGATAAHDATDRFVYNTTTGVLFFDADGLGGKAAVAICQLGATIHPVLSADDIIMF